MKDIEIDRTIKKIEVFELFGYYNYCIDYSERETTSNPLLIIYGDNGSGKTTLLKMIFYLLSPINKSGHKTKLSEIKFNKFILTLNDNTVISAIRKEGAITGGYLVSISQGIENYDVLLETDADGAIQVQNTPSIEEKYLEFLKKIKDLSLTINFLSDDRKILSFSEQNIIKTHKKQKIINTSRGLEISSVIEDDTGDNLDFSIKKLENWIKSNVLKGAKAGDENTNTIYNKLIKQISTPKINHVSPKQVQQLLKKISKIQETGSKYYESGLISEIEIEHFESALKTANSSNIILIYNILEPYIDGIQGRLNSLSNVQNILSKFLDSINNYFSNKKISYKIETGFALNYNNGQQIDFQTLSSGEKQLLHLFSNVITSSENSAIFIIDEPEISLNVKWQRKLINTLLNFAIDKKIQFIFASHSIELLSGHRNSVYKLPNSQING